MLIFGDIRELEAFLKKLFGINGKIWLWVILLGQRVTNILSIFVIFRFLETTKKVNLVTHSFNLRFQNCTLKVSLNLSRCLCEHVFSLVILHYSRTEEHGVPVFLLPLVETSGSSNEK